jgi:DNA-binding PucR family transcriptional regulator
VTTPGVLVVTTPGVLVVTTPPVPLDQAPAAYRLAVAALHAARVCGSTGTHSVVDLAGETALAAQPMLAAFLRDSLPAKLDPADGFHRELVGTALAYLDHGQRLDRTAGALHLHPNTVRYRLRRLQELTGFGDSGAELTVLETVRWWWALRTWSNCPGRPRG